MDRYLQRSQRLIVLISCSLQVSVIVFNIAGTELYLAGRWLTVGLVLAATNLLPIMVLPCINKIENGWKEADEENTRRTDDVKLNWIRKIAVFMPDLVVFLNNVLYYVLAYVLPTRVVDYLDKDLGQFVVLFNISNWVNLFCALVCGYITERFVGTFNLMLFANVSFCAGCFLAVASTTISLQFLNYPYQLILSVILIGIGETGHDNLTIYSKHILYKRWGLTKRDLGEESTASFNLAISIAAAIGAFLSAAALSRESETPLLVIIVFVGLVDTAGIVVCKSVS